MNVSFVKGIVGTDPILTEKRPHIVFVGRSNVGKSSIVNALVGEKIARSSSTPGKTREINFFLIDKKRYLVDLPGYGYARLSEKAREKLRKHLLWYLFESRAPITLVVIIIDAQVGLKSFDEELLAVLRESELPAVIVGNKEDKLNQRQKHQIRQVLEKTGMEKGDIFFASAKTGRGISAIRTRLFPPMTES
jgi:GTP-binding protein